MDSEPRRVEIFVPGGSITWKELKLRMEYAPYLSIVHQLQEAIRAARQSSPELKSRDKCVQIAHLAAKLIDELDPA